MTKTTFEVNQDIKVTVDAIVFGYNQGNGISVLLIKRKIEPFKYDWTLPGGFVLNHETLGEAVERELRGKVRDLCTSDHQTKSRFSVRRTAFLLSYANLLSFSVQIFL